MIPFFDPKLETDVLWDELHKAVVRVLRSGKYILGSEVESFEAELSEYLGVRHAVGVNSGTDALVIALRALDIGPGDEVITSPFTFFATAEAVSSVGARPVFADIDPGSYTLDPVSTARRVTPRTRAIIPVHLFGHAADMGALMRIAGEKKLFIIEDCAQAFGGEHNGQKLGTIGDVGAFSFFPTKNLGGYGDGGMVVTNDGRIAELARSLRSHGAVKKYHHERLGYNSRLDELQAAMLRVKLRHVDRFNKLRRENARRYSSILRNQNIVQPSEPSDVLHVYNQYTIRVDASRRDRIEKSLSAAGIGVSVYYREPLHIQLPYVSGSEPLAVCDQMAREVLSLPFGPFLSEQQIATVASALAAELDTNI